MLVCFMRPEKQNLFFVTQISDLINYRIGGSGLETDFEIRISKVKIKHHVQKLLVMNCVTTEKVFNPRSSWNL
jgi:hypothetical protein